MTTLIQVLANRVFEHDHVDGTVKLGNSDGLAETANGLWRVAASAQSTERRHAGIVPASHVFFLHELQQLALGDNGVGQVQSGELDLLWVVDAQLVDEPIVEGTVILEFECADGVRDAFLRI